MTSQREGRAKDSMMTRLLSEYRSDDAQATTMKEWHRHVAATTVFGE